MYAYTFIHTHMLTLSEIYTNTHVNELSTFYLAVFLFFKAFSGRSNSIFLFFACFLIRFLLIFLLYAISGLVTTWKEEKKKN